MSLKGASMNSMPNVHKMVSKPQSGGIRKKNGHKDTCGCPICKNMKHAKGAAGYDVTNSVTQSHGRKKKSNGHKVNCGCPICMNMKKSMKKRGGDEGEEENETSSSEEGEETSSSEEGDETSSSSDETSSKPEEMLGGRKKGNGHKTTCGCPICMNMKKGKRKNITMKGGKKPKGHKATCGCPICKKIRNKKSRKTRRG